MIRFTEQTAKLDTGTGGDVSRCFYTTKVQVNCFADNDPCNIFTSKLKDLVVACKGKKPKLADDPSVFKDNMPKTMHGEYCRCMDTAYQTLGANPNQSPIEPLLEQESLKCIATAAETAAQKICDALP